MSTIRVPEADGPGDDGTHPTSGRYFRRKRTPRKPFCFVVMPFSSEVVPEDVYRFGIKLPVEESGYRCHKAGGAVFSQPFMDEVFSCIREAAFVIADLTGMNPNVLYELGIAHALDKDVILISQDGPRRSPADLTHLHIHHYTREKIGVLRDLLTEAIASNRDGER